LNKLMDVVSQSEAAAKTATDAIKSGKAAAPVLSTMRQEAQELNKAVQQAAKSFDPAAGQFNAGDVKAAVQRGTLGNASASAPARGGGAAAPKPAAKKASGAVAKTGAGGYSFLEGTLTKEGGKGGKGKKRFFRLGKNTLTFAASAKDDAKVLGIIQLSGGSVTVSGTSIKVTDAQGRASDMSAKTAAEASKWGDAITTNVGLADSGA
jgi:hypothetical protein